eukprot:TRINITY_DN11301_c0_g2_i6.p1 TRINITY_DN11301_c0_g2~~TRINITY_DN11301_c0_g2_i6.p1  ORF type:complete len:357 (+),score=67.63 TRINITY_DN11301_c0_g2_i6:46-1071(+)
MLRSLVGSEMCIRDRLHAHYGAFGEISDVAIMKDRQTGKPRGFGFVSFVDPAVAEVVVNEKHTIDGRTVDTKLSVPREQMRPSHPGQRARQSQPQLDASFKKLFLGGLSARATEDSIATYFSRFGTVHEVLVMRDRNTGASRGFGFCTFEDAQAAASVLQESRKHTIDDKNVEVKPAESREACNARSKGGWRHGKGKEHMGNGSGRAQFMYDNQMLKDGQYGGPSMYYPPQYAVPYPGVPHGYNGDPSYPAMPYMAPANPTTWNPAYRGGPGAPFIAELPAAVQQQPVGNGYVNAQPTYPTHFGLEGPQYAPVEGPPSEQGFPIVVRSTDGMNPNGSVEHA